MDKITTLHNAAVRYADTLAEFHRTRRVLDSDDSMDARKAAVVAREAMYAAMNKLNTLAEKL